MVVNNFDVDSFSVMPKEADPVPVIDSNAVLAGAAFPKGFELKSGTLQVMESSRRVQDGEFPIRYFSHGIELPGSDTVENLLGLRVLEARYHFCIVYRITINGKADP